MARARQERASIAAVGSILEHLPDDYSGIIWGSGLTEGNPRRFENAHVVALRGHLTRKFLGVGEVPLGDPGLLVSDYLDTGNGREKRPGTATVRHFLHAEEPFSVAPRHESYSVDVTGTPDEVVGQISKAARVLTSSLHGLVVADAFGVPAAWYRERGDSLVTSFKFQDYESVVTPGWSRRVEFDVLEEARVDEVFRRADLDSVRNAQADLRASLREVAARLPHKNPVRFAMERRR
ncbi:polysaccharide pyruvyl transferase family protein [Janibacter indicus]|uniref:polysaccharide pyruvyl transferase family protein n=1 Tax=Janibacter indicus TaxID=857417 RepID=UPI003EBC5F51